MVKKISIHIFLFLCFFSFSFCQQEIKAIASGRWNDLSTWDKGIPTSADMVIIQKGYTVEVDTYNICLAGSLSLETGASLFFNPTSASTSALIVFGNVNLNAFSSIIISPNSPNTVVNFRVYERLNMGQLSDFVIRLSTSTVLNLNINHIVIEKAGSFSCLILDPAGDMNFYIKTIENKGIFDVINYVPSVRVLKSKEIVNTGFMKLIAQDPDPLNPSKPDPPTVQRYLVLEGVYNDSYFNTVRDADYSEVASVGTILLNIKIKDIGIWEGLNDKGDPLYGVGFIGKAAPIDGIRDRVDIYNCEITGSADTGIFFKNCKRINRHWREISISSNVIHNCVTAGIWFMDNVEKCDIINNKVYNIRGGNVGYGILLGMPFRIPPGNIPDYPKGFANENYIYKNEIYNNKIRGIYVFHSHKNLIDTNKCYYHLEEGISLKNSLKNIVILNECYNNDVHGIALDGNINDPNSGSRQNYIANNKCFNNGNGGLRVRYNSNENIFLNNVSSGNARTALASHSSVGNLFVNETYYGHFWGDIYIEGEENQGYISQMWLKSCLLGSSTEFVNTPEKQEFTKEGSWVFSQCHDRIPGLTRIWGQFSFPDRYHTWHTNDTLKFNYDEELYLSRSHGWNTVVTSNDTAMLRYDDGGIDGPEGSNDISSITISSTTKTEVWIITYRIDDNRWIARGTVSGIQTRLVVHDTDFISDNGEVRFRITHRYSPISPGEEYVFVTIASSNDRNTQKVVNLCDFSDPNYIGASFTTKSGATLEIRGTQTNPVIFTRKLAEDKNYAIVAGTENFYYGLSLGGTINKIENANFSFVNKNGLELNSSPLSETENIVILRLQPFEETSYITANNITHTFSNVIFDTYTATLGVVKYGVKAINSTLHMKSYTRPYLLDKTINSSVNWYPLITWSGLRGFESDGVEPDQINRLNSVEFTVKYIDLSNTPPTTIQVWVDLDDDLVFSSTEQFGLKLKPAVGNNNNFVDGEIYHYVLSNINYPAVPSIGRSGGKIKYRFFATNPNCITISTYSFNLQSVYNVVLSSNEASGQAREIRTFSVRGTPPVVKVQTPTGKQTDLVRINYVLYDYDDKPEPYNLCSIRVEYKEGTTWKPATRHDSSESTTNLVATLNGKEHYFIWDSRKDIPNKDIPVSIRITPIDEDGEGSPATTGSFQVDNIIATQLVFKTQPQELKTAVTSQVIIVEAQDENGNKDVDINGVLSLVTTSTGGVFISLNDVITTTVSIVSGEARFRYRDDLPGTPIIMAIFPGLSLAQQVFYITKNISLLSSSVRVLLGEEMSYAEVPVGSTTTIVVTLRDVDDQPVSNKEVVLYSTGSDFVLTQPQSPTNIEGKAYATLFTTKAGLRTITARIKDEGLVLVSSATINFYPALPSAENSFISSNKTKAIVGETISLTVRVVDKYHNPISSTTPFGNIPVRIEVENASLEDILVMLSSYPDVNGIVRATFTGNTMGTKVFKGFIGGIEISSQVAVEFISGDIQPPQVVAVYPANNSLLTVPINQISFELSDASGISESSTTVVLYDPQNNVISGQKSLTANILLYTFPMLTKDGRYRIELTACDIHGNSSTYIFYFEIQTRDPQKIFTSSLLSYPNPSNIGNVFLRYSLLNDSKITIKVFNMLGELIWETSYDDTEGENKTIQWLCETKDKQKVGSGVYIIKIMVEDKKTNKKFEVVRRQVVIKK